MLFSEIDIYDFKQVSGYFQRHYPRLSGMMGSFRLMSATEMDGVLDGLQDGVQITFHAFPGRHLDGNAYAFPRFIRVEGATRNGDRLYRVTREKAIRDRLPSLMSGADVIQYYFELADMTYLQAEEELRWSEQWPPEARFNRR